MKEYFENLGIETAGVILSFLFFIFGDNKKLQGKFRLAIFALLTLFLLDILNEVGVVKLW